MWKIINKKNGYRISKRKNTQFNTHPIIEGKSPKTLLIKQIIECVRK